MTFNARAQLLAAMRSLPWYLVGGFLFGPLILAPFTAGASLAIYLTPIAMFSPGDAKVELGLLALVLGPGLAAWILRQFVRAAVYRYATRRGYHPAGAVQRQG